MLKVKIKLKQLFLKLADFFMEYKQNHLNKYNYMNQNQVRSLGDNLQKNYHYIAFISIIITQSFCKDVQIIQSSMLLYLQRYMLLVARFNEQLQFVLIKTKLLEQEQFSYQLIQKNKNRLDKTFLQLFKQKVISIQDKLNIVYQNINKYIIQNQPYVYIYNSYLLAIIENYLTSDIADWEFKKFLRQFINLMKQKIKKKARILINAAGQIYLQFFVGNITRINLFIIALIQIRMRMRENHTQAFHQLVQKQFDNQSLTSIYQFLLQINQYQSIQRDQSISLLNRNFLNKQTREDSYGDFIDQLLNDCSILMDQTAIQIQNLSYLSTQQLIAIQKCRQENQFPQQIYQLQSSFLISVYVDLFLYSKMKQPDEAEEQSTCDESNAFISNSSIHIDYDGDLKNQYDNIGLLICIRKGEQAVTTSTAFLINQRTLITCIHSFENDVKEFVASEIIFIPGCKNSLKEFRYRSLIDKSDVYTTNNHPKFQMMEIGRQLAIVFLENPIKVGFTIPQYISIDQIFSNHISIVGYPENKITYNFNTDVITETHIERRILYGDIEKVDKEQHKVEYKLPTRHGMSGSPIIGKYIENGKEKKAYIGIHTRGASNPANNNSGLAFTPQIIKQINKIISENPYNDEECQSEFDESLSSSIKYILSDDQTRIV